MTILKTALEAIELLLTDNISEQAQAAAADARIKLANAMAVEPEPYDQQAMDLCNVCGWKGIFPGEPCLVCTQQAKPTDWSAA